MNKPKTYRQLVDRDVEAVRWGPTWEEMQLAAKWLGSRGVPFRFDSDRQLPGSADMGLPPLFVSTFRFDEYEVRIGDWLVVAQQGRVRVVPNDEFKAEHP
ncbi:MULTISPECIES: hypothetical protein [Nocardia]|uniref:hypothetical protein n=1 Tax=Nocardia TaxID=1817 RepID=UPI0012E8348B|nr:MULTISPECIES: hypothetical protein [Nocardia]